MPEKTHNMFAHLCLRAQVILIWHFPEYHKKEVWRRVCFGASMHFKNPTTAREALSMPFFFGVNYIVYEITLVLFLASIFTRLNFSHLGLIHLFEVSSVGSQISLPSALLFPLSSQTWTSSFFRAISGLHRSGSSIVASWTGLICGTLYYACRPGLNKEV